MSEFKLHYSQLPLFKEWMNFTSLNLIDSAYKCWIFVSKLTRIVSTLTRIVSIELLGIQFRDRMQWVLNSLCKKASLHSWYSPEQGIQDNCLLAFVPLGENSCQFTHLLAEQSSRRPFHCVKHTCNNKIHKQWGFESLPTGNWLLDVSAETTRTNQKLTNAD